MLIKGGKRKGLATKMEYEPRERTGLNRVEILVGMGGGEERGREGGREGEAQS